MFEFRRSDSAGAYVLRRLVADSIEKRDGYPCSPEDLYMTDGASPAVHYMMDLLLRDGGGDALMVPIPQVHTAPSSSLRHSMLLSHVSPLLIFA